MAMGPCVRNLLSHYCLDPGSINSTGPHQVILKSDVITYINQNQLQPAKAGQSLGSANATKTTFKTNLDTSGYQPKPGPEGFSRIAKQLLEM